MTLRIGWAGPGENKRREKTDAGGQGETDQSEAEPLLPMEAGHEKGKDCGVIQREDGKEKGERFGEIENHAGAFQLGARCIYCRPDRAELYGFSGPGRARGMLLRCSA